MKKTVAEYTSKEINELHKNVAALRKEIAQLSLEKKIKPHKDTNVIAKKKKNIATLLTIIRQKELGIIK